MKKAYVEKILSLNGLSEDTSDEEIRSFLDQANWPEKEIDKAIRLLRETVAENAVEVSVTNSDHLEKFGYQSKGYSPEKIQTMLGIKLNMSSLDVEKYAQEKKEAFLSEILLIGALSLGFMMISLLAVAFYYHIDFVAYLS